MIYVLFGIIALWMTSKRIAIQSDMDSSQEVIEMSQNEFAKLFSLILDLVCIVSTDGYFKGLNPACEETLGYLPE
jgi:PAS domain-containing protein